MVRIILRTTRATAGPGAGGYCFSASGPLDAGGPPGGNLTKAHFVKFDDLGRSGSQDGPKVMAGTKKPAAWRYGLPGRGSDS